MLDQLLRYAASHNLAAEPGFAPKTVRWALDFSEDGRFLAVHPLGDPEERGNPGQRFDRSPELSQPELKGGGAVEPRAHFLIETGLVVTLLGLDSAKPEDQRKAPGKHAYFLALLDKAQTALPELAPVVVALGSEPVLEMLRTALADAKAKPTDKVTLRIGGRYPVESEAWHDWWRSFRLGLVRGGARSETTDDGRTMVCFATGELTTPAPTHPKIKGLGTPEPALIGYDKEAFRSFGLEQSANGAVSPESDGRIPRRSQPPSAIPQPTSCRHSRSPLVQPCRSAGE